MMINTIITVPILEKITLRNVEKISLHF